MDFFIYILAIIYLPSLIWCFWLTIRIKRCESLLKAQSQKLTVDTSMTSTITPPQEKEKTVPKEAAPIETHWSKMTQEKTSVLPTASPSEKTVRSRVFEPEESHSQERKKGFTVPQFVKDNWMGIFGSFAIVAGAVFFAFTSEIMQQAEMRVVTLITASFLFFAGGYKTKNFFQWKSLSGWLNSIAGALILFTAFGAGGIEGLKCIENPLYASLFLLFGIGVNVFFALTSISQAAAILHTVLSIAALFLAPQSAISLPLGAIVASSGLYIAYKKKWDIQLIWTILSYSILNSLWASSPHSDPHIGVTCSFVVGLLAGLVHYSKVYQSSKFDLLPFLTHLLNWGLLYFNLQLYELEGFWIAPIVGCLSICGFVLARLANRKGIDWLYQTDSLLSLLLAIVTTPSLVSSDFEYTNLLVLAEVMAFNLLIDKRIERLIRIGYTLQNFILLYIALPYGVHALTLFVGLPQAPFWQLPAAVVLIGAFYMVRHYKKLPVDDMLWFLFGNCELEKPFSKTLLWGAFFITSIYAFDTTSLPIRLSLLTFMSCLIYWRKDSDDISWRYLLLFSMIGLHLVDTCILLVGAKTELVNHLGLIILDCIIIFANLFNWTLWERKMTSYLVYPLSLLFGLVVYNITNELNSLIPTVAFLALSLLALEVARGLCSSKWYDEEYRLKVAEAFSLSGTAYLGFSLFQFVTVNLQVNPLWNGIGVRWILEGFTVATMLYWLLSCKKLKEISPAIKFVTEYLVELTLGYITLVLFTEFGEALRPLLWALTALTLIWGTFLFQWPKRLRLYSWIYLLASIVHLAFVTSSLTMPALTLFEKFHIAAILSVIAQLCYAFTVYFYNEKLRSESSDKLNLKIFNFHMITILLPIFCGLGLLFAYNFEKAVLTLLWAGLAALYLGCGLIIRSKITLQIAMSALLLCSLRLLIFDMVQTDITSKAMVFVGVGALLLGASVIYKKYKHRIEVVE